MVFPRSPVGRAVTLAAGGGKQAVDGVVAEAAVERVAFDQELRQRRIADGRSFRIVQNAAARRPVANAQYVPDQIVVVAEVLQGLAARSIGDGIRFAVVFAAQPLQAERLRIIGIARHNAIAIGDQCPLTLGVVSDALDIKRVVQPHLVEPAGAVVFRPQLPTLSFHVLRELHALNPVQGIVARSGLVGGGLQQLAFALCQGL